MNDLLNGDIKHYSLDMAEKVVKAYDKPIHDFLDANKGIYEDYLRAEQEGDYSLAEYLWYGHWEEVAEYLLETV